MNEAVDFLLTHQTALRTIATVLGIGGAAASAAFIVPSIVDRIRPLAQQDSLADYLPFIGMLDNGSHIKCVNGRYISIIEISGAELSLTSFEDRIDKYNERKMLLDNAEKTSVEDIRFLTIKEKTPLSLNVSQDNRVLQNISNEWNKSFSHVYNIRHYAIIVVKETSDEDAESALHVAEEHIIRSLSSYRCRVMTETRGAPGTGPLAILARIASPLSKPTPSGRGIHDPTAFNHLLTADKIDFSAERDGILSFTNGRETLYASVLGIRDCGEKTSENAMRAVLGLDCEMLIYQAVKPLNSQYQKVELTREAMSAPVMTLSPGATYEFQDVIHLVDGQEAENRATLHHYALNIILYGKDVDEIAAAESDVIGILAPTGATCVRELMAAQATWFSMFPSDTLWPRRFRYLSTNIATNLPLQRPTIGRASSDWSERPIAYFKTLSGEAYRFNFHAEEGQQTVGHCVSIGPTGTGKTTFITFLASQALSIHDLSIYLFDRLNGCEVFTRCAGGQYITFDEGSNIRLNPLFLPDSPGNRAFLRAWLSVLGERKGSEDDEQIARLIAINYMKNPDGSPLPSRLRKLSNFVNAVLTPGSHLRKAMTPWADDTLLGRYFNGEQDTLDLTSGRLIAFDMTVILDDPRLSVPIVDYLTHRIRLNSGYDTSSSDTNQISRPSLIFIDETEPMLRNAYFRDRILKVGLQEGRKMRQAFILAFQRPEAINATGMGETVRGQCQTAFFYRNPSGKPEDYADWGLTDAEMSFVLGRSYTDFKYAVLVKNYKLQESVILDINLAALGRFMKVFSSGRPQVIEVNKAIAKYGPNAFVEPFLNGEFETA